MEAMGMDAVEAAREANDRVNSDEASAKAASQRQQTEAKISIARPAAMATMRARMAIAPKPIACSAKVRSKRAPKTLSSRPEPRQRPRALSRKPCTAPNVDRLNGSRKIYGEVAQGFEAVDGMFTPGLDAFKAKQGKPLINEFKPPSLDALRANQPAFSQQKQQATARESAESNGQVSADGPQMVKLLGQIVSKLSFAT